MTDDNVSVRPWLSSRRRFLASVAASGVAVSSALASPEPTAPRARIAITFDLEMSRHYPRRGMMQWDYEKGNLDQPTKQYAVEAARIVKERGGVIHFFCVGRTLEQADIDWLREIADAGHPIGNHTYDHVNVMAATAAETQFRFQRAPWLVRGKPVSTIIADNIRITNDALRQRMGVRANGFRTPGGFRTGLAGRQDLQQMLLDLGFRWVSSKYPAHRSGVPRQPPDDQVYADIVRAQGQAQPFVYPTGLVEIPMSPISDVTAFRSHFWKLEYFIQAIELAIGRAIETGGVFDFLCHPSCMVVEDPGFASLQRICDLVQQAGDRAEIIGLDKIAAPLLQ